MNTEKKLIALVLIALVVGLGVGYGLGVVYLNVSLSELRTLLRLDQPEFLILDAYPEEGAMYVKVIVWNIGGKDAHDVFIGFNLTTKEDDWVKVIGNTTVPVLKAGELARIKVPWTVIRQVRYVSVVHIEIFISCAEGVTKQEIIEHSYNPL